MILNWNHGYRLVDSIGSGKIANIVQSTHADKQKEKTDNNMDVINRPYCSLYQANSAMDYCNTDQDNIIYLFF